MLRINHTDRSEAWQRAQSSRLLLRLMSFLLNLLLTWLTARSASSQAPADRVDVKVGTISRYSPMNPINKLHRSYPPDPPYPLNQCFKPGFVQFFGAL